MKKTKISDTKVIRAAQNLKRYCGERGCDEEECIFKTTYGICILQATRLPEDWNLDGLKPRETSQQTR